MANTFNNLLLQKKLHIFEEIRLDDPSARKEFKIIKEEYTTKRIELPVSVSDHREFSIRNALPKTDEEKILIEIASLSRKLDDLVLKAQFNEWTLDSSKNSALVNNRLLNPLCRTENIREYNFFNQYVEHG